MPVYNYKARDSYGKLARGALDGISEEDVIKRLTTAGYMVTRVKQAPPRIAIEAAFERLKKVSVDEMVMFNIQLSNMIGAGISIVDSLGALSEQIANKRLKEVMGEVKRNIEAGDSFSKALSRHPYVFPKIFISMVSVAEVSGKLDAILSRYAYFCEQQQELRQKINGALFYPFILLLAGIAVTLYIVTFVIPQFAKIFIEAGIRLPAVTLIMYQVGNAIKQYWYLGFAFILIIWAGLKLFISSKRGRVYFDAFKLKVPIMGVLLSRVALSRLCRTLGTLLASGVGILESLDIVRGVIGNEVISSVVYEARDSVEAGRGIAASLKNSEHFPPDMIQMVSAGETTGRLSAMLYKISDFYDTYIDRTVKKLTTIIEPLFLVIMGCIIGFIMASLLLPMFDMVKLLRA
ncbi:MAG: type II secretion system F family protein [Candidatus Omnitrophota bacterium]